MEEKQQIEKEIRDLYPNLSLKILAEGGMSYAFEVGGKIVRVPKNNYATDGYRIEEKILNYLQDRISIAIPNVKIIETPFFHTIHKKLEGKYWSGKEYINRTEREKDALAYDCAKFFAELHSSEIAKIDTQLREIHPIKYNLETYLSTEFSFEEREKIVQCTDILFTIDDKVLIHNDFYYDNFFVDDNYRLKSVIDFGNGGFYNFNFDFRKIVSYEDGERDFWKRIVKHYEPMANRTIDIEIIKLIDIHNYISFLVYFAKNPNFKDEKIGVRNNWNFHVEHIKDKLKKL
ncbi:MAG: aminoglycoside phosphotransferase family protein [Dysgonamonadaceae bacterium]|jgi:aminoglycoside phosphotransferase|nr:aminoglycoside phosphotransferase family protein [Dysgonamonadaceae bacterium]